jgi:hypothetical protein
MLQNLSRRLSHDHCGKQTRTCSFPTPLQIIAASSSDDVTRSLLVSQACSGSARTATAALSSFVPFWFPPEREAFSTRFLGPRRFERNPPGAPRLCRVVRKKQSVKRFSHARGAVGQRYARTCRSRSRYIYIYIYGKAAARAVLCSPRLHEHGRPRLRREQEPGAADSMAFRRLSGPRKRCDVGTQGT